MSVGRCLCVSSFAQIATFFSNNLDFFASAAGYGPRGGMGALNPLQAESMLGNKKQAAAYMQAIRKVSVRWSLCPPALLFLILNETSKHTASISAN